MVNGASQRLREERLGSQPFLLNHQCNEGYNFCADDDQYGDSDDDDKEFIKVVLLAKYCIINNDSLYLAFQEYRHITCTNAFEG